MMMMMMIIIIIIITSTIFSGSAAQRGLWPRLTRCPDHTQRRVTVGSNPLDE
jgi:hypothetical protein